MTAKESNIKKRKEINELLKEIKTKVDKFTKESEYHTDDLAYVLSELKNVNEHFGA